VLDVLIIGAGLSGIGAARHLQNKCPEKTWRIWEARAQMGGTWDLFRYPGVRSDSDMLTLGYAFKPWVGTQTMADGASILSYIQDAAHETGVAAQIHYGHKVTHAAWSSLDACWTLTAVLANGDTVQQRARFVHLCGGYYSYERGHQPVFAQQDDFKGELVYPQFWPAGLSHANKRVVVIGSGATAVTLVPAMAQNAAHVTMLQRSPSYVVSLPSQDPLPMLLGRWLPKAWAHTIARWKNIVQGMAYFQLARQQPAFLKKYLVGMVRQALGPGFDVRTHFTPRYNPWTQRVCALPDGDLFKALKAGRASVVTDHITHFTPEGVALQSGQVLAADMVVVATGLQLNVLGDVAFAVDGVPFEPGQAFSYKGCMLSGLPNVAVTFGYTNASWTLKADLIAGFVCRLLKHMDQHAYSEVRPTPARPMKPQPFMDFSSGYVTRSTDQLPKQGDHGPWRVPQNYLLDLWGLRLASLKDGALRFSRAA
jgi:cyclohexanone monooxygenase